MTITPINTGTGNIYRAEMQDGEIIDYPNTLFKMSVSESEKISLIQRLVTNKIKTRQIGRRISFNY